MVILALVKPLENRLFRRQGTRRVIVLVDRQQVSLQQIEAEIESVGLPVSQITLKRGDAAQEDYVEFALARTAPKANVLALVTRLQALVGVLSVSV